MAILKTKKCDLHYEVHDVTGPWVEAPETILFHHGIGTNGDVWMDWLPLLADRYRIVRFDMRGFGRSGVAVGEIPWAMDHLVEDLFSIAEVAGCERFHFVGESLGGSIGLCSVLKRPSAFLTVTASNASHFGDSIENVRDWREMISQKGMAAWSARLMDQRFHADALPLSKRAWYNQVQETCAPASVLGALGVLAEVDICEDLVKAETPALILHPDASPFISVASATDLHARLPHSELRVFPHTRHGLPFSHARQCAETLRDFLSRQ